MLMVVYFLMCYVVGIVLFEWCLFFCIYYLLGRLLGR